MAYPDGRLLALREVAMHVLAPDGWTRLRSNRPPGTTWLTREEAEGWCAREGWDPRLLDDVPTGRL